jgi:hypothetical protein
VRGKRPDTLEFTIYPFSKLRRAQIPGTLKIDMAVKPGRRAIVYREFLRGRYLMHGDIWRTGYGILLPRIIEIIQNLGKGLLELKPAAVTDYSLEVKRPQNKAVLTALIQGVCKNERVMVKGAGSRYGNISKFIKVWSKTLVRTIAPAVPVSVLTGIKRHLIIVKEIGRTGPGTSCKACFHSNGVSFCKAAGKIHLKHCRVPHLAHYIGEEPYESVTVKLQLRLVTGFVGYKLDVPWGGV